MSEVTTNCYECEFRGSNSDKGSAHSHCKLYWQYKKHKDDFPKGNERAKEQGWFDFPYDYDPIWIEEDCERFMPKGLFPGIQKL